MTIGELIDFYLAIRQPAALLGFADLYEDDIESLKQAIQEHYGSQEAWLALPESDPLPEDIDKQAKKLVEKYEDWKG